MLAIDRLLTRQETASMFRKAVVTWGLIVMAAAMALDLGAGGAQACWGCGRGCGSGCGAYCQFSPAYGSYFAGYGQCRGGYALNSGGCYRASPTFDGTFSACFAPAPCAYVPAIYTPPAYIPP